MAVGNTYSEATNLTMTARKDSTPVGYITCTNLAATDEFGTARLVPPVDAQKEMIEKVSPLSVNSLQEGACPCHICCNT